VHGEGCVPFLQWVLPQLGMRWGGFRKVRGQVCKRVAHRIRELGLDGFTEYRRYLESEVGEWGHLDSLCRVTISRFFRDRGVFELIGHRLLPEVAEVAWRQAAAAGTSLSAHPRHDGFAAPSSRAAVECWSAGCASGEEPYTLSLLWRLHVQEHFPDVHLRVVATDSDEALLVRARAARYPPSSTRELGPDLVNSAFDAVGARLRLRPPFREGVDLVLQDVRSAMPRGPFHLVLCRNLVFTYFDVGLQATLLGRILDRLRPAGYLVLGAHERLPPGDWPLEPFGAGEPVFRRI
jgi:chemotaxis protein methyltransferase CheR